MGLAKSTWYYAQQREGYEAKYGYLRKPLLEIAEHHPEYGYRRTTSELQDRGYPINHKVVERLHRSWYLAVMKKLKAPKPNPIHKLLKEVGSSMNLVSRLKEIDDLEVLYTDFTEVLYQKGGAKAQLMPIVDHHSKLVVGHAVGSSDDTDLALEAWRQAKQTLKRLGQRLEDVIIHHDQDGVYVGHCWVHEIIVSSKSRISYSEKGAKENVHMESFNGRFKQENRDLFWDQEDLESLKKVVAERVRYYNFVRKHSALGNKSPMKYLKEKGKITL